MKQKEDVEKYRTQSIHYFENALGSIQAGEAGKAGEFLWGSVAEAFKAVAAYEGKALHMHGEIREFARDLAKREKDPSIWDGYAIANSLHSNFYEAGLNLEEIQINAERIRETITKLLNLLSEKA